eukprot:169629_1
MDIVIIQMLILKVDGLRVSSGHWKDRVDWHGNNVRYDHPPGTMIMYESAKFIHGRPYPLPRHPNHPKQKYVHLGAFSHFTPADGSWKRNGHDSNARKNLNRHTKGTQYKSNPPYYPPKHYQTIQQETVKKE